MFSERILSKRPDITHGMYNTGSLFETPGCDQMLCVELRRPAFLSQVEVSLKKVRGKFCEFDEFMFFVGFEQGVTNFLLVWPKGVA